MKTEEKKEIQKKFSTRLNGLMNERNLSQSDVVRLIEPIASHYNVNIYRSMVCRWCNGETMPKQNSLLALSKALGVNPTWLLGYDNVPMNYLIQSKAEENYDILRDSLGKLDVENVYKVKEYIDFLVYKQGK